MDLAGIFLSHAGGSRARLETVADLGALLAALLEGGRAAWEGVELDAGVFLRHMAARLPREGDPLEALRALHAADLYLACACAAGDARAVATFEAQLIAPAAAHLRRSGSLAELADEVAQVLRLRLLVAEPGSPPRILDYTGRGPLAGWVRTAAVRTALDLRRRQQARANAAGEAAAGAPPSPDPELDYLKAHYRPEFKEALSATLAGLEARERSILRLAFLQGLTTEQIAPLYQVTSRTVRRWLEEMRAHILEETLKRMSGRLGIDRAELDGIVGLLESQLDLSITKLLRE
jgi:RNA polymerase sigma-70 factor (ECF subfamily)